MTAAKETIPQIVRVLTGAASSYADLPYQSRMRMEEHRRERRPRSGETWLGPNVLSIMRSMANPSVETYNA